MITGELYHIFMDLVSIIHILMMKVNRSSGDIVFDDRTDAMLMDEVIRQIDKIEITLNNLQHATEKRQ